MLIISVDCAEQMQSVGRISRANLWPFSFDCRLARRNPPNAAYPPIRRITAHGNSLFILMLNYLCA